MTEVAALSASLSRQQYLAAREQVLSEREAVVEEAECRLLEVEADRKANEKHAQELVLREAGVRETERRHGTVGEREDRLRDAEVKASQLDDARQLEMREVIAARVQVDKEAEARYKEYERLVMPLVEREEKCLLREEALRALEAATKASVAAEEEKVKKLRESLQKQEDRVRALQHHVSEARGRVEKREIQAETMKQDLLIDAHRQKKKSESLEQRSRAVEWQEKEALAEKQKLLALEASLLKVSDELERKAERLLDTDAQKACQLAELNEQKLALRSRARIVADADRELEAREKALAAKESEMTAFQEELRTRASEVEAEEIRLLQERTELEKERKVAWAREKEATERKQGIAERERRAAHRERELLVWMRENAWREDTLQRSVAHQRGGPIFPPVTSTSPKSSTRSPRLTKNDSILVFHQLQTMKEAYYGAALSRRTRTDICDRMRSVFDSPKGVSTADTHDLIIPERRVLTTGKKATESLNAFQASIDEARCLRKAERDCKQAASRVEECLAKHPFLEECLDRLPVVNPDDIEGVTTLTDADTTLLRTMSCEQQQRLKQMLNKEREGFQDWIFYQSLRNPPLFDSASAASPSSRTPITTLIEQWYVSIRQVILCRYTALLTDRLQRLVSIASIFEAHSRHCTPGKKSTESVVRHTVSRARPHRECRVRALAAGKSVAPYLLCPPTLNALPSSSLSKCRSKGNPLKPIRPVDTALQSLRVKNDSSSVLALCTKDYYEVGTSHAAMLELPAKKRSETSEYTPTSSSTRTVDAVSAPGGSGMESRPVSQQAAREPQRAVPAPTSPCNSHSRAKSELSCTDEEMSPTK
ncbi:hypothetical protein DIPPA_00450 [Diplonema papillatum]|nr:hypothetical protein DIPPA_00450 [Diplonema papillatum]